MEGRFKGLIESFIVIALLLIIYWVVGFIVLKLFNKEIRTNAGYFICIISGFILKRVIIILLSQ